ncbi:MAG: thioredoxin family protein [Saprospiraceae bacterium]|nr:thioredoxin family protein [Saprospiraceae bacterium]
MKKVLLSAICIAFISSTFSCGLTGCNTKKTTSTTKVEQPKDEKLDTRLVFQPNDDLSAALTKAKAEKKAIFIDFYTTWCMPCRMMDESVFRDWDVAEYMAENVVSLKVNAEKGRGIGLKNQFGVGMYPTFVFIGPNGSELSRNEGTMSIADFKKMAKTAVWKVKNPN